MKNSLDRSQLGFSFARQRPATVSASAAAASPRDITRRKHGGNPESTAAHAKLAPHLPTVRDRVEAYFLAHPQGLTAGEVWPALGTYTTVCPRISELKIDGVLVDTGKRRNGAAVLMHRGDWEKLQIDGACRK